MLPEKHWPRGRHGELAQPAQHSPGPASFPPLLAYQFGPINYAAPPVPINAAHGGVGWERGGGERHGDAHRHPPPNPRGCLWGSPRISFPLSRPSSNAEIPDAARQAFFLLPTQPRGGRRPAAARTAVGSHRTAPHRAAPPLLPAAISGSRRGRTALPGAARQGKARRLRRPHRIPEQPRQKAA